VGVVVRDDDLGVERGRTQHPDRVVVREHQVPHRLVGVLTQLREPVLRGDGGCQRLEAHEEVLALDRAEVGIALCRERVDAVGEDLQGLLLLAEVGGGGEGQCGHGGHLK